ncbi:MAG TPA: DUF2510 domain-containing protein [Jatrophihabitans sp.]|nr:DUF2510 domain-containing protein [Jatrophihabitans sp.]
MAEAGWYPDPQEPGFVRFFDGRQWTGERRPLASGFQGAAGGAQPSQPTQHIGAPPQQAGPAGAPGAPWSTPQHGRPPAPPAPAGQWPPAGPPAPAAPRRSHARLIGALAAVVVVAAGVVAWLLWPGGGSPALTYGGRPIAAPASVLTSAEQQVAALVGTRHGADAPSTRCYFARPRTAPAGRPDSDVEQTVWCGPVLFVDGERSQNYLAIPLMSSGSGGAVTLRTAPGIDSIQPQALDQRLDYVRPDGLTPPKDAGISAPKPPAAEPDLLTTAPLGPTPTPKGLPDARIVGRTAGVTLLAAGEIPRYGEGDAARSAPPGQKLYAFFVKYGRGDIGRAKATAEFVVGNGTPRPLPVPTDPEDWIIAAVPDGSSAKIVLDNAGYEQSLSVPDGAPGPDNIAVLLRKHRAGVIADRVSIPVHLANSSGSADVVLKADASTASLDFWIPGHTFRHPTSARDAVLSVHASYYYADSPGKTYGFDPALLHLRLPDGTLVNAQNVAGKDKIYDVFVVPADFTRGTLEIGGQDIVQGVTVTIERTIRIPISIPAG